ncbi:MAG: L-threonylcarbamoyladenylate synthase, partial [bacterium]
QTMENTTENRKIGKRKKTLRRILILQTAFIGDVVLVEPLIACTKRAFPQAWIDVMVIPAARNVLETHPAIDELIVYDKRSRDRGLKGFLHLLARLKKSAYDLAIVPHRSFRSALLVWLAGIPRRIGFDRSAGHFLFNNKVQYRQEHEVERNLKLLKPLGIHAGYRDPVIYTTKDDDRKIADLLAVYDNRDSAIISNNGKRESRLQHPKPDKPEITNRKSQIPKSLPKEPGFGSLDTSPPQGGNSFPLSQRKIIALAPGSVWATKRWPEEKFHELGRKLYEENRCRIVLIGGEKDRELCANIAEKIGDHCKNFAGTLSLRESVALLKRCDILVSNDSAPTHLGVAAGCRVATIFGATVPRFGFYPYGNRHKTIETHLDLHCRPCGIHGGRKCPIGTFECMHSIRVEKVSSTVKSMLKEKMPAGKIRSIIHGARSHDIEIAVDCLKKNGILLVPTETLYGLAANALSESAVKRIFDLKFRTTASPLPLIFGSAGQTAEFCQLTGLAKEIAEEFWPGPLTLVLKASPKLPGHIIAHDGTVAVRVPDHAFCREIALALQAPITATSANISGEKPAQKIQELPASIIDGVDLAFDAGACTSNLPSTIIRISENEIKLLRRGKISLQEINARIGVSAVE